MSGTMRINQLLEGKDVLVVVVVEDVEDVEDVDETEGFADDVDAA